MVKYDINFACLTFCLIKTLFPFLLKGHYTDYTDIVWYVVQSRLFVALNTLTLTVLVATIDAQWEGMGDVGLARYEPALLLPCLTIRVLSYSN